MGCLIRAVRKKGQFIRLEKSIKKDNKISNTKAKKSKLYIFILQYFFNKLMK